MKYLVDWTREARSDLAAIWIRYKSHRNAVTAAQATMDRLLSQDPLANGFPLSEGLYGIHVSPLRATFEMSSQDVSVTVESVNWLP
jgi:hypothetical protein